MSHWEELKKKRKKRGYGIVYLKDFKTTFDALNG